MDDRDHDETAASGTLDAMEPSHTQSEHGLTGPDGHKPRRREFTLEEAFGSVTPLRRPEDLMELSRLAKEEKVARTLAELDEQSRE
jgi:hypothetical protein